MAVKSKILEVIGGGKADLLLMEKVRRALQANERVKYLLTLLQLAQAQAQQPSPNPDDLSLERRRAGIDDAELDQVIPHAVCASPTSLNIPNVRRICALAMEETARMCHPLVVARRPEAVALRERLEAIHEALRSSLDGYTVDLDPEGALVGPTPAGGAVTSLPAVGPVVPALAPGLRAAARPGNDQIPLDFIGRLTSAERGAADSLHLVVMDAHKAINGLISELSSQRETIGGADALGLTEEDRELLEAFTAGVNSTRFLKGTHPGLATTAVRVGSKLMIQNDVGETDAHVVVVEVEDGRLELTYTDVHEKRTDFFARLVADANIRWKKTESRFSSELTEGAFTLSRGVLESRDRQELRRALTVIGGSLVFLIDWNKARKRLRTFLGGQESVDMLVWAAQERVGHMAFLSYGDEELIYELLEALPRGIVRRGEPFEAVLGRKGTIEFLKDTLRLSWESYERKEPRALLLDRLRLLLLGRVQRRGVGADEMLLELAELAVESSLTFRDALRSVTRPVQGLIARSYDRIRRWEERADERLNRIRKIHLKEPQSLLPVAVYVDDALDALEDAADLALALEAIFREVVLPPELVSLLEQDAETAVRCSQLFYRILHRYRELVRGGIGEALFDLINELKQAEMWGDRLKREFYWKFLSAGADARVLLALRDMCGEIETAINSFKRAGYQIHDLAYAAMERIHG